LQADHPEYQHLTPTDLPGVQVIIDGRGCLDPAVWEGVTYRTIGNGHH
ncbi:MAG: nucleotide sugar dehydrogenase, partial [Propionibacteriaceae bacterium]|nr:nucleotide sugar dehydrogenase [Propionibacteriaceae bacterium]